MPKSPAARRERPNAPPRPRTEESAARPWWQRRDGQSQPIRRHPWFLALATGLLVAWLAALAALAFWSG
ncbi:MAG: hypothetical protein AB7U73_17560 [Pirellulales bacterium]